MFKCSYRIALQSILRKEINRFLRIWLQTLVPPVITVSLYFVIFGNLIGARIGSMAGVDYMSFIVPGLIMMSVITNSYSNVASSFFSAKFQNNIEELLVAPVPNYIIIWGYVGGGMIRGLMVGGLVTCISLLFVDLHIFDIWVLLLSVLCTSMLFSLAGLLNALFAKTFDDISIIPSFVLTPPHLFRRCFLFHQFTASFLANGFTFQPCFLYDKCISVWFFRHCRCKFGRVI